MDLKEIKWKYVKWIYLAQDREDGEHDNKTSGSINKRGIF
jgi:hypothetical protein